MKLEEIRKLDPVIYKHFQEDNLHDTLEADMFYALEGLDFTDKDFYEQDALMHDYKRAACLAANMFYQVIRNVYYDVHSPEAADRIYDYYVEHNTES